MLWKEQRFIKIRFYFIETTEHVTHYVVRHGGIICLLECSRMEATHFVPQLQLQIPCSHSDNWEQNEPKQRKCTAGVVKHLNDGGHYGDKILG